MSDIKYVATRVAYGQALKLIGDENPKVVAFDADVSTATYSNVFAEAHSDRFFDMGIAEANMVGAAAGMADAGYIPFVHAFAIFGLGRAYDQVRNTVAYSRANVKLAYTHCGITGGPDGGTHQAVEDLTLARAVPGLKILCPCDENATYKAVKLASEIEGPVYLRLCRQPSRVFGDLPFTLGGSNVMREGNDAVIFCCGLMLGPSYEAAEKLSEEGIQVAVVDLYSINPIDEKRVAEYAAKSGKVITVEENIINGGLADAVAQIIEKDGKVEHLRIGVNNCFGQSGDPAEVLAANGLDVENICAKVRELVKK